MNEGGTPAYAACLGYCIHWTGISSGEKPQKFTGPIEPGEEIELSWYLEPTGISGRLPILTISSSAGQDLKIILSLFLS